MVAVKRRNGPPETRGERVVVPLEVQTALLAYGSIAKVVRELKISRLTYDDIVAPGARVRKEVLERIEAALRARA